MSSHLAVFLPSLAGGGAERAMVNLIGGLHERGISVDLVLGKAEGPYLKLVPAGVRVIDLGAPRMLLSLRPLVTYLRRERPRVLLSALDHASIIAITAARLSRTQMRVLVSIQSTVDRAGLRLRIISRILGAVHRGADAFLAVSEGVADDIVRTARIPRNRVKVLFNPVITQGMKPLAAEHPALPWFDDPSL